MVIHLNAARNMKFIISMLIMSDSGLNKPVVLSS